MEIAKRRRFHVGKTPEYETVMVASETPDEVGNLAFQLLDSWGLVVTKPDPNSAGFQRHIEMSGDEIAERAWDIAEAAFKIGRRRGHILPLPPASELYPAEEE